MWLIFRYIICVFVAYFLCSCSSSINLSALENSLLNTNDNNQIITLADKYLQSNPVSVAYKMISYSGNKNNYESISIYYWKNEVTGQYEYRDGICNPEYKKFDYPKLLLFTNRLKYLSLAYFITRNAKYLNSYLQQINVWFIDHKTRMNPNFQYSQLVPGINNNQGTHGLIDAYHFIYVLNSLYMMKKNIPSKNEIVIKQWFRDFALWIENSQMGRNEKNMRNNHGIAYDILMYAIYSYLENYSECQMLIDSFQRRLENQIMPSGRQPYELSRTSAYKYSVFNLGHIIDFCTLLECKGVSYYKDNRKLIDAAFDFLIEYESEKERFPYQEISDWSMIVNHLNNLKYRRSLLSGSPQN